MSTTMMQGSSEVLSVLSEQHEQLKALMQQVVSCPVQDRRAAFDDVRHLLAAHEAAEVEVVHPLARRDLGTRDAVVAARLAEEDEAGAAIGRLEQLDITSGQFASGFAALQTSVIAHAEAEEHQELPAVAGTLDSAQKREILAALTQVPVFAHSPAIQLDTFAAMLLAARDHFRRPAQP